MSAPREPHRSMLPGILPMPLLRTAALAGILMVHASAGAAAAPSREQVVEHYSDIALATYTDALAGAHTLQQAIATLVEAPDTVHLQAARAAWKAARRPYMQTEVFRFGNPVVDAWEGRVNAWPLDEGLIDYVDAGYGTESDANAFYTANLIARPQLRIGGRSVDATRIDRELLAGTLHEIGGVEANVATGYHAIEFLLWGQDLNGTAPGAGARPATDFSIENCSNGHCERRIAYLQTAIELLVDDLQEMVEAWQPGGAARAHVTADPAAGIASMLTGIGSLSYGELAGERMKLGLILHDPEEEQDCFSDNTHESHFFDQLGIRNVYLGRYERVAAPDIDGPSLSDLVKQRAPELDREMRAALDATGTAMQALRERAETVEAYDQMIGPGNRDGNAIVQTAIDRLIAQTRVIERIIPALEIGPINLEGSASLDDADAVFQ
jgi:putative iron-regulated protein